MQDFNNKVAVITGGASGVGRSLAFALGRLGAKIAVGDGAMSKLGISSVNSRLESFEPQEKKILVAF